MKCPFCDRKFIYHVRIPFGGGYSYLVCEYCGGGILDPKPSRKRTNEIYRNNNYFKGLSRPQENNILQWLFTRRVYRTPAEWVCKEFKSPKSILDVGCGNGEFLDELEKSGYDIYGTDVSDIAVRNTNQRIRRKVAIEGDFVKSSFRQRFDLISFWHILEHVANPYEYLRKADLLLMKRGYIIGEMPNLDSPLLHLFTKSYAWAIIPEHVIYFSRNSLKTLLKRSGYKSIEVSFPPRGLLNFSFSLEKSLKGKSFPTGARRLIFFGSIPFSVVLGFLLCLIGRGEVLRFTAKK